MRDEVTEGGEATEAVQTPPGLRQSLGRDRNERDTARHPSSILNEYDCECASPACEQLVSLTAEEYVELRSVRTHFVVARGHLDRRTEFVVRESARYQVVEK